VPGYERAAIRAGGRARHGAIAAIAISALMAGCGGPESSSSDEEAAVAEAVTTFNRSLDERDGASGCEVLTEEGQQELADFTGDPSCEEAIDGYRVGSSDYAEREVGVVSVEETTATAQSVTEDGPIRVPLENADGDWKISDPPL
jgi:hypothetical protein